jgi:hypothetical protein
VTGAAVCAVCRGRWYDGSLPTELGAKAGSNCADQVRKADGRMARLYREKRTYHECPDGYQSFLTLADTCPGCGWSAAIPVADLPSTARGLVKQYGPSAGTYAAALLTLVEEFSTGLKAA